MLTPETVQQIAEKVAKLDITPDILSQLRNEYETLHFTYCMDDDINHIDPVLETEQYNFYLVDGREHCLCLTKDYNIAQGVVIAEVIND